ncbi:MAG: TerC/Alx family metal homeostasis membrane protein [Deltaproteobacteria bacterium]|nr:TerC/Alx family metal homeostasis membrane protein [Deltaproteobacteria bacterium]
MSSLAVPVWVWALLGGLMIVLVSFDLFAHRGDRVDSHRRAILWSLIWVACALAFGGFVTVKFGLEAGEQYLAAYLLEKSLSVDNLFLFIVIFSALRIPAREQRRVLTWGIVGALVTRGLFIAAGATLLQKWHAVTYVFGGLLIVTALKLLRRPAVETGPPRLLGWLKRHVPWTDELQGHHFIARVDDTRPGRVGAQRLVGTPLLVALIAIELTDVVFAIDSIPAAFAVTREPFIVYSSNVFAILGLRALYIVLAGFLVDLRYLRFGLAAVLGFAGAKLILAQLGFHVSPAISVTVIIVCIGIAIAFSVRANRRDGQHAPPATGDDAERMVRTPP